MFLIGTFTPGRSAMGTRAVQHGSWQMADEGRYKIVINESVAH
jgi:hypothetical protein